MTNPRHDKKLIPAAEAAEVLDVSRQRIHQLVKEGKLTGFRDRTYLYVVRAEVEALKASRGRRRAVPPGWLSKEDVAERFGVSPRTVNDWHIYGHLRGTMSSTRMLMFRVEDVENFRKPPRGRPPKD